MVGGGSIIILEKYFFDLGDGIPASSMKTWPTLNSFPSSSLVMLVVVGDDNIS